MFRRNNQELMKMKATWKIKKEKINNNNQIKLKERMEEITRQMGFRVQVKAKDNNQIKMKRLPPRKLKIQSKRMESKANLNHHLLRVLLFLVLHHFLNKQS